ncbi:MAG: 4Fe-4S dicluster domain-containing protein [Acholeplasmataceae bacterium]|nr:MAG: 4Fe-4S dicluster domain-containing protein [Acholeplasmataceae bacterium]
MMLESTQIIICGGERCLQKEALKVKTQFETKLREHKAHHEATLHVTGCLSLCEQGLIVAIFPDEIYYQHVKPEDVEDIVVAHFVAKKKVDRLVIDDPIQKKRIRGFGHLDVFRNQKRIALRNCGVINPLDIDEYIAREGYLALAMALENHTPDDIVNMVTASGLRGRGGGGFPTGRKWAFARQAESDQKYVICNADEGDPGAFMDRAILEGDPHNILEAMAICGYAIGANQGYIYVRAEYPVAVERLEHAIKTAHERGFLGSKIFGTDFDFDIELRLGAGAFVCGEETALIASIEGLRGMPRLKPPFPAQKGLWGKPTNVNNVETFANIPVIIVKGPDWFKTIGTEHSPGTKVFALGGKIKNTGLVEIPMGTTLRDVVYKIGGGIPNRKQLKAIQTGGPSGGCITAADLETPIDFDTLTALGSMMGSGGMIIMDEDNCMVDVARFYLEFTVEESCGKCGPCREGTKRMLEILDKICTGKGTLEDLETLETLGMMIKETSLCGLGQTAPNPVLSTLKHFKDEYLDHVLHHTCTAGVCRELTRFTINDQCVGCTLCATNCPVGAITGWPKQVHTLDMDLCICCGACKQLCPVKAIITSPMTAEVR